MFKKLAKQLKTEFIETSIVPMVSPIESLKKEANNNFLKKLSKHALNLYERKTDINNFTKLALSNPENDSHNKIMDELFGQKNVVDPFSEEEIFGLSHNERFLKDLGLDK